MADSTENVKQDTLATDESTKQQGSDESYVTNEKQIPFMINKTRNSITQYSDCPPSPLLLERSVTEFERQVEVVYISKMIPRPTSSHMDGSATSSMGRSTLKKNGTLTRSLPRSTGAAYIPSHSRNPCVRCCSAFRDLIENSLHSFFYNYGKMVGSHPWGAILFCIVLTALCGAGMIKFRMENTGLKLWIPHDSSQR